MKKAYLIIPATIVLLAIIFLLYKFLKTDNPCEAIFQQTAVQLTSSLKVLQQTGGISIGDQKIQDLTEAAQVVALNLKTCCIMNMNHQITSDEFLKCQQMGDQYNQQVNDLVENVDKIEQARKNGDSSTMNQALTTINSQLTNLQQSVQQITGIPPKTPVTSSTNLTGGRINLINVKSGGHIFLAPNESWKETIDTIEQHGSNTSPGEAVYGFKNERKAAFDMFCMLIPDDGFNVKEFALYSGNDSPAGRFDSIGSFTTQNARLFDSPYQQFKFPGVTAKYIKVKIISYWNNSNGWVYKFQLWGTLK